MRSCLIKKLLVSISVILSVLVLACSQAFTGDEKPNILVICGDDIGDWNISHINRGMMGYEKLNIDRLANEGLSFTDYYGEQSCTAGRSAFISGQHPVRTGLTKVILVKPAV